MTGRDDEELAIRSVQAGAQDYVVKSQVQRSNLAKAIRYAMERNEAQQALHEKTALATLTADVGTAFTRSGSLREMLQACAESLVANLRAAFARIWTLNDADQVLELQASAGMYTHLDGSHSRVRVGEYKIGLIALQKQPHLSNDVLTDPRISDQEWARREEMVAFAGYPLLVEDRLVGVMALFARHRLSASVLEAMAAVANSLAVGIERKENEAALRQAQERLQHVLISSPAILYTLAVEGTEMRLSWISANVSQMMGYPIPEVLQPLWWQQRVHPEDYPKVWAQIQDKLFADGRLADEYRFRHGDGRYRWVRSEMRLLRDAQGRPMEVVGSWSDVTERRAARRPVPPGSEDGGSRPAGRRGGPRLQQLAHHH